VAFQDQQSGGAWQDRQMFDITCSKCGAAAQVPFAPTAGRDVYCRDCFREMNPRRDTRGGGGGGGRGGFRSR